MDPFSQGLLGASIGEGFFRRKLGRKATLWGTLIAASPDLDVLYIPKAPLDGLVFHRGPTHSLWFPFVFGPLIAIALWFWFKRKNPNEPLKTWVTLAILALLSHPLLDLCTVYGTQLLAPFSNQRFAIPAVGIIDPFFTVPLFIFVIISFVSRKDAPRTKWLAPTGLILSITYLVAGLVMNVQAETLARKQLVQEGLIQTKIHAYPTLGQIFLRRIVVRDLASQDVHVGYVSMWSPKPIVWKKFTQERHPLIDTFLKTREAKIFVWFANNQIASRVIETPSGFQVEVEDLRYGLPDLPAYQSLWGVKGVYDRRGNRLDQPEDFMHGGERDNDRAIGQIFRMAFGLSNE